MKRALAPLFLLAMVGIASADALQLVEDLKSPDATVRLAAAVALRDLGPGAPAAALLKLREMAEKDPDEDVRTAAWAAVNRIEAKKAGVAALLDKLGSDKASERMVAAKELGAMGPAAAQAAEALQKLADQDPDMVVRSVARNALARVKAVAAGDPPPPDKPAPEKPAPDKPAPPVAENPLDPPAEVDLKKIAVKVRHQIIARHRQEASLVCLLEVYNNDSRPLRVRRIALQFKRLDEARANESCLGPMQAIEPGGVAYLPVRLPIERENLWSPADTLVCYALAAEEKKLSDEELARRSAKKLSIAGVRTQSTMGVALGVKFVVENDGAAPARDVLVEVVGRDSRGVLVEVAIYHADRLERGPTSVDTRAMSMEMDRPWEFRLAFYAAGSGTVHSYEVELLGAGRALDEP